MSTAKKGYREGAGSGNLTVTVPVPKSYDNHIEKKNYFLCVYPLLVLRQDLVSSQDSRKVSQGIFQNKLKIDKVIEGERFLRFDL